MTPRIQEALATAEAAEKALRDEIAKAYPVNSFVEYRIRDGVASRVGKVLAVIGGLDGKVRLQYAPNLRFEGADYEQNLPVRKIIGTAK